MGRRALGARPGGMGLRIGVPGGVAFGQLTWAGSGAEGVLIGGLFVGAFMGAALTWLAWRRWPLAAALDPADRVAVVHAVRTGGDIGDARLAGAVLDFAGVVVRARAQPLRRIEFLIAGLAVLNAVVTTSDGDTRATVVTWLVAASLVVGVGWWLPRLRARRLACAHRAELAARRLAVDP